MKKKGDGEACVSLLGSSSRLEVQGLEGGARGGGSRVEDPCTPRVVHKQQYQLPLACQKYRLSGPTPDWLNQKLHFNQ